MRRGLEEVEEFHKTFGFTVGKQPYLPDDKVMRLRINLLEEELEELKEAFSKGDLRGALDAMADIQYVLDGTVISCGMQKVFEDACSEVHRSNMSKACITIDDAIATKLHHKEQETNDGFTINWESVYLPDKTFHVVKRGDGKLLKSLQYSPARLERYL